MGNIYKGTIAGIEGNTARVIPSDAGRMPQSFATAFVPPRASITSLETRAGSRLGGRLLQLRFMKFALTVTVNKTYGPLYGKPNYKLQPYLIKSLEIPNLGRML